MLKRAIAELPPSVRRWDDVQSECLPPPAPPPAARAFITVYGCLLQHISAVTVIHSSVLARTSPGLLLRSRPSTFSSVSPFAFL